MRNPNIHRVQIINERDNIKIAFEEYKVASKAKISLYRYFLIFAVFIIFSLCFLLGLNHV